MSSGLTVSSNFSDFPSFVEYFLRADYLPKSYNTVHIISTAGIVASSDIIYHNTIFITHSSSKVLISPSSFGIMPLIRFPRSDLL